MTQEGKRRKPTLKMSNLVSFIRNKVPRHFSQVTATLAVSLGPFAAGLGKGYSSPALASLQESKTNTFHVSAQEGSWIASLSLLGALFGCLMGGMMLQIGRKRSLMIVALPFAGSWLLTVFAERVEMIYSTSFIGGFFSAIILLATQVYVSEIAHSEIRGCLSAVLKMSGEIGTLLSFALGAFLDWRQLATFAAVGPILLFLAILFIPETPSFLLYHGREEEACKAMAWLRPDKEDIASEIEVLRKNISSKYKSFFPRCSGQFPFRQLFITCGLMFFQKFSGVTVFHHYAVPIFKQVFGRSIDAHGAAIAVLLLRLFGSLTSGLLIDTAGRLPLLIISNLFISASFFGFGFYNWIEESLPPDYPGFDSSLDWIPLTCVLFFTLFFSIGIGPISWLMVSELFPLEYRGFGSSISTAFSYASAFAAVKTYVDIRSSVGLYGAFWIYSAISAAGLIFVWYFVPETKGLELEEMHNEKADEGLSHELVSPPLNNFMNPTVPNNTQQYGQHKPTSILKNTSSVPKSSPSFDKGVPRNLTPSLKLQTPAPLFLRDSQPLNCPSRNPSFHDNFYHHHEFRPAESASFRIRRHNIDWDRGKLDAESESIMTFQNHMVPSSTAMPLKFMNDRNETPPIQGPHYSYYEPWLSPSPHYDYNAARHYNYTPLPTTSPSLYHHHYIDPEPEDNGEFEAHHFPSYISIKRPTPSYVLRINTRSATPNGTVAIV